MKIKDLERVANIAWSPAKQAPILLAAGTAAQQLDASFNTSAALEVYSLNLGDPGQEMELKASTSSEHRFHKIVWGSFGSDPSGTIVGGCDAGIIQIYSVSKLLQGESGLVSTVEKHVGPVHSLDFNSFQANLLATGASESEIYIWDMNNTTVPMTPGAKLQPGEDIVSIQWNKQVQHILASTFTSKCVVWDLRKNEPIIKLMDTVSRIRWKVVAWHPEVATQLCLASEEDQAPLVQLWDLRFATSPLKTLENHQRGVLSMAWCTHDPDLLITSGKDNRIVCWNPNSNQPGGEVLSEIARTNQWNFDVTWCPRNPALIASPSFDGHVSVHSLMGGKTQQILTTNKIADSFPGMDGYIQAPVAQQNTVVVCVDLSKAPRWLKRPVGAKFGFGGKLITFTNDRRQQTQTNQAGETTYSVYMSQVVTEADLINKSMQLEQALEYGNFLEYCKDKADSTPDQHKKYIWYFLRANFEENPRTEILNLLGYKVEDVNNKLNQLLGKNDIDGLTDHISHLSSGAYSDGENNVSSDGSNGFLQGDFNSTAADDFESIAQNYGQLKISAPFKIKTENDSEGLIAEAILMGNIEAAVDFCVKAKKYTEAIIIAMAGGPDLLSRTQYNYLRQSDGYLSFLISALIAEDWSTVVDNCDITSWKEALIAIVNHCNDENFPKLCERLGNRLSEESIRNPKLAQDAQLCYICSGSFDKLVQSWSDRTKDSPEQLQELVELVMFLQKAIERQGRSVEVTGNLADLLTRYAFILASQGNLQTALNYLGNSETKQVAELKDRLYISLGQKPLFVQRAQPRRTSMRQSFSNQPNTNQFNQPTNQFNQPPSQFNPAPVQTWQQQPTPVFVPQQQQPPKPFSPAPTAPPPTQPPRPTSVGSAHGGSGLPSRSKYVVDPSVHSNVYRTNQYNPIPMTTNAPQMAFQPNAVLNTRSNPYAPVSPINSNFPLNHGPNPYVPSSAPNPPAPLIPAPAQAYNSPEIGQPALNALPPMIATPSGWNDPPAYSKSARTQPKLEYEPQEPITHPLYGAAPASNLPYPNQGYNQPEPYPTVYQQNNFNSPPAVAPVNFNQNAVTGFVPQKPPAVAQPAPVEKPQPVQKGPIPEEHAVMQSVLDELKRHCSCATNNLQTKRKIEDVGKKLEALYDLLREHKLSPNTLASLHQVVQLIQNGDYAGGLNLHTQLVSGPDFAQIASFMPGLKVLLQSAMQLQVYLR